MDRLVRQRAGRAGGHAFAARYAGRGAHRVAQVERDVRGVTLSAAPDHVVALNVVARPGAPVAEDAGVVVDRDDRAGLIDAAAGAARQGGVVTGHPVPVGQREQFVVAGRGLLGVALARRLVGNEQLGQHRAAALELRGIGRDLHAVLAGPHARRGERGRPHVDHAHPADAHRIETFVVAQHGDVDAGGLRGLPDRRTFRGSDLTSVDRERYRPRALRGSNSHIRSIRPPATLSQAEVVNGRRVWAPLRIEAAHVVVRVDHRPQALRR